MDTSDPDDSDFYGDADTADSLQDRVDTFDIDAWRQRQISHPGRPLARRTPKGNTSGLHNPYAGVPYAWQLTETVDEFLERLPPETTTWAQAPWIFICNPYIPRVDKRRSDMVQSKGRDNGDEAPDEEGTSVGVVVEGGMERLGLLRKFIDGVSRTDLKKPAVEKEIAKQRTQAANDILDLAHAAKVRPGKWMIFCPPRDVNEIWAVVAKATASNELGIAAKVAPVPESGDTRKERLICVYTADFKDKADVARVVRKLRELQLIGTRSSIYYKPDAFTYIGISSGNPWGIRPSLYSSLAMLR